MLTADSIGKIVTIKEVKGVGDVFRGKQGRIVCVDSKHEDGPIGVEIPSWYRFFDLSFKWFLIDEKLEDQKKHPLILIHFNEDDFEFSDKWDAPVMSLEENCRLLFGNMGVNCIYTKSWPFIMNYYECEHYECKRKSTLRVLVNNHGTVSEHDVCVDHADYHGRCCDGFPIKPELLKK